VLEMALPDAGPKEGRPGDPSPVEMLMVAWMVAGVQTQYDHLAANLPGWIDAQAVRVNPYRPGGFVERLPIPASVRGTLRSTLSVAPLWFGRRPDVMWTQVTLPMLPYLVTRGWAQRIPVMLALDTTPALQHGFAAHYPNVTDPATLKGRLTAACFSLLLDRCAALLPWSRWAADSIVRDYGADPAKVTVIAPGIDTARWTINRKEESGPVKLLFVGGDFGRKGGRLLLELYRTHLRDRCQLDMVTTADIEDEPGVRVHRGLMPTDPRLQDLYRSADIFVLPTLADCFSMAALEAMASGLPVVISDVGGISEIVIDGETGRLVPPGDSRSLLQAIVSLLAQPGTRARFGAAGRRRVEDRFDAIRQAQQLGRVCEKTVLSRRAPGELSRGGRTHDS
jgi:glycosyltransferase involved in cell wall biosynthesis